jgi:hypothetical protein
MENSELARLRQLLLPARYRVRFAVAGLAVSQLQELPRALSAVFAPLRSRGASCRRATATSANGDRYIVEFASFADDYIELGPKGILRGTPKIECDRLILDHGVFRDPGGDAAVARTEAECK